MMKTLTPSGAFGFYAAICSIGWVLIILFYPEVSGLTLEEVRPFSISIFLTHSLISFKIGDVFEHGFGVRYARNLRKERKAEIQERMKTMEKPLALH